METVIANTIDRHQLAAQVKHRATELGFDLVGIAPAQPSQYRDYFRQWLESGQHGAMAYLANRFDERTDPAVYFPGAKSVICVAMTRLETESIRGSTASVDASFGRFHLFEVSSYLLPERQISTSWQM